MLFSLRHLQIRAYWWELNEIRIMSVFKIYVSVFGSHYSSFLAERYKGHGVLLLRNQMISSQEQRITLPD